MVYPGEGGRTVLGWGGGTPASAGEEVLGGRGAIGGRGEKGHLRCAPAGEEVQRGQGG